MSYKNLIKENVATILVFLTYILLILLQPNFYNFHRDELHACNIAYHFNLFEIINLMPSEGHTFLWYLIIKPFLLIKSFNPWVIKWINLFFVLLSLILLWYKAPLTKLTKLVIIFSNSFLLLYPISARCYGVGILLLFVLTVLYNKKQNHPVLYPFLIFLTANTSLMALVGAGAFGFLYLYKIIKSKNIRPISVAFIFTLFTALSLHIQWHNPIIPDYCYSYDFFYNLKSTLPFDNKYVLFVSSILISILTMIYFFKSKEALFFTFFCWLCLIIIFCKIYAGWAWHHHFFFIYLIIGYWLNEQNNKVPVIPRKIFLYFFCAITLTLSILIPNNQNKSAWNNGIHSLKDIAKNKNTIYVSNIIEHIDLIAYSETFNLKNYQNKPLISLYNFKYIYKNIKQEYDLLKLSETADKNSYLLIDINTLENSQNKQKFKSKYKPIGTIDRTLFPQKKFLLYHFE